MAIKALEVIAIFLIVILLVYFVYNIEIIMCTCVIFFIVRETIE